jgi:tetratricopeptide (TPR) repeat protein
MSDLRDKATAVLLASGVTTFAAAALQGASLGTPAPGVITLPVVLATFAVVVQGVSGLITNVAAAKLAELENQKLAERNHLVRIGMAQALRDAMSEEWKELEASRDSVVLMKMQQFFKIWLDQLDLALDPKSEPAIVEALFPLHISEEQWKAVTRYELDEERVKKLPEEVRQRYAETQEADAEALADLLADHLTFPPTETPSILLAFWRKINAAPEFATFADRRTGPLDRSEALALSRRLLPLYRRAFAKVFATGGPAKEAIGFKGLTLSLAKLDEIIGSLDGVRADVQQGFGDLGDRVDKGFSRMESRLDAIGPMGASTPRVIPNYVFRLTPLHPAPLGRDADILALRDRWLAARERPSLIWGTPGIGKSTLARAVLRDAAVAQRFGARRYEVRCDAVSTVSDLILKVCDDWFGVKDSDVSRAREFVFSSLAAGPCAVLVDNFETLMSPAGPVADESQDWLCALAAIQSVWLIVGVMGFEAPRGIHWQKYEPGALTTEAARLLFNESSDHAHANDPRLEGLLEQMAGVPHAILLLAGAASGYGSLADVEADWRKYGMAVLKGHGSPSRLDTIEAAYKFAISRLDQKTASALRVLACLPAGLAKSGIDAVLPNGSLSARLLKTAALAWWDRDRLKMLSPLRRYVADFHQASEEETRQALVHFLGVASAAQDLGGARDGSIIRSLSSDQPNAAWAIRMALDASDTAAIGAAVGLGNFSTRTGLGREESTELLLSALNLARRVGEDLGTARCLVALGDLKRFAYNFEEARAQYTAAIPLFQAAQDKGGEAWCASGLGDIARLQNQYEEARAQYRAAIPLFQAAQDKDGEAGCAWGLGEIARRQNQYDEARAQYRAAIPLFQAAQDKDGEAFVHETLGDIHSAKAETEGARYEWTQAVSLFRAVFDEASQTRVQRKLASRASAG